MTPWRCCWRSPRPNCRSSGVTTVCGNVPVGQATKNLFRLLNVVQPPPGLLVGQGAARPLEEDLVTAVQVHGSDGLGELDSVLAEEGDARDTSSPVAFCALNCPGCLE
jgi:inosine-uridine nucleoside N-ribohydrolase